ncbi:GDP-fucose protein O-fucosyltransferase 2 isoform X2 [Venturia canescens]|uniref:GDP-fucose protein O-fucosyltransferase 2 isoform X2 n=1 Tax=Venturia canescens TaxID=32260 RepID=UPI001C9C8F35|nr:GDP-fucose protein O-fucosyltransferase 2 isoform X2 [Venturia canescens]
MENQNPITENINLYSIGLLTILIADLSQSEKLEYCERRSDSDENKCGSQDFSKKRYFLYDVNPSEGFNLRRDVYVRVAAFIKKYNNLDTVHKWNLVLPPWERMYHWRSRELSDQKQLPWSTFFDISSLNRYIPILEMYEFFQELSLRSSMGITEIDQVYILQNDLKMFQTGNFKDKNEVIDCPDEKARYRRIGRNEDSRLFWGYKNLTARNVNCLLFHGTASGLQKNLEPEVYRSFMFDRMEIALHDHYGSQEYWRARRSMRYNELLYKTANEFRLKNLKSEDTKDKTPRIADWTEEKGHRNAKGGPYLAVHLRRRDFLRGRAESVPSIPSAAEQLRKIMQELDLKILFIATDAVEDEYEALKNLLHDYEVYRYVPTEIEKKKFKDGGVAIIDQIICSHARYFVGTHESTFTFRIQEDREIMGFPTETTFNRLCGKEKKCSPGGQWTIVW